MERLQKVLARAGIASRRACEAMIIAGRVAVNGQVVTELGTKVEPSVDVFTVDGLTVGAAPALVYLMLNKPIGYVSTTSDPQRRPTALDLVKARRLPRLFLVGRLDADSEGLLLLTNDGPLTLRLTHPRFEIEKEYTAWLDGQPSASDLERLRRGVPLDGKPAFVDGVEILNSSAEKEPITQLSLTIHEGRKHEVRRLCEAIGYPVLRLQRVRLGPLRLGELAPGAARPLTEVELRQLKAAAAPRHSVHQPIASEAAKAGASTKDSTRRPHAPHRQDALHHHNRRPRSIGQERSG